MIYLKDGNIPLNLAYDDDIVQEANSTYQLSFKFPLTDKKWKELKKEVFILADDLHGEQEFFIFEVKKANGYVQVYAKQVATLLNYYSIDSISVDRVPGQTVMTALAGSVKRSCPFTFFSDIVERHTFNESNVSAMDALAKEKHSILGQWGGDLVRDKYQVKLLKNGGIENESLFMYKKNLSSYEESENINNLKTRLHLKKTIQGQSESEADRVIAVTVDSPLINQYNQIYEADIEVNDQDVTDEASLLAYGQRYFSSTLCDLVENSINLDVKGKSGVAVKMFDTVSVYHERFDVDLRLKITSYHFTPMSKRLKSIGFGKVSQSVKSTVASMVAGSVDKATNTLSASFEQKLQKEIDNANQYFDAEFDKQKIAIEDGIEQAKAEAELYADNIKQSIDADVNAINTSMQAQSEEHDRQVADILSKTQSVEDLANQAKTDAVGALARANQVKTEAIADARAQVATVSQALSTAKTDLQNQVNAVDAKAVKVQSDATALRTDLDLQASKILEQAQALNTAKTDLQNQVNAVDAKAQTLTADLTNSKNDILAQAHAQTALNSRVSTVETTANGTKETVTQLSKTVNDLSGEVTSATQSIKTVEDSIDGVYTTLSKITLGGINLFSLKNITNRTEVQSNAFYYITSQLNANAEYTVSTDIPIGSDGYAIAFVFTEGGSPSTATNGIYDNKPKTILTDSSGNLIVAIRNKTWFDNVVNGNNHIQIETGSNASSWQPSFVDTSAELAEYKQAIDGQLTSLSASYQTLDGRVAQNTARIKTTADSIREDVTSLQSYVDDEGTRRTEYLTASELKTAELIATERTKVARDYTAKSTYTEDVTSIRRTISETKSELGSVANRTKTVEDTLSGIKTNYAQLNQTVNAQTGQIESINRKTADLQSGIDGVTERFENLMVGATNYIRDFGFANNPNFNSFNSLWKYERIADSTARSGYHIRATCTKAGSHGFHRYLIDLRGAEWQGRTMTYSVDIKASKSVRMRLGVEAFNKGFKAFDVTTDWQRFVSTDTVSYKTLYSFPFYTDSVQWQVGDVIYLRDPQLEDGNIATTPHVSEEDLRSEIATYKRTADQNYAGLQSTVSTLDGKVTQNKSEQVQTAEAIKSRLNSLETYKDAEGTRAQAYFETSKTETAKQLTAERTAIANNYVAKSVYDEDARGTTLKLNEVKTTADTATQNLATYQNTVDGKLEELTSSTQTLDGKINTASAKVDTVAGQIRTEISNVEGKIPTFVGGRNLLVVRDAKVGYLAVGSTSIVSHPGLRVNEYISVEPNTAYSLSGNAYELWRINWFTADKIYISGTQFDTRGSVKTKTVTSPNNAQLATVSYPNGTRVKFEKGSVVTDWSPAPEDFTNELSSVKTTITQTASGVEQLSTSLSTTNGKVTTAETKINQLISDVSSKVSQTDYNTLTGRVDNAETAITQNATEISKRLTSTQVEQAITDKGYATVTVLNNKVKETADSFSRTISETRALIPTEVGATNYIRDFGFANNPNFNSFNSLWKYERIADSTARSGYHIRATCTQAGTNGFHRNLIDLRGAEWQGRTMTYSVDIKASKTVRMRLGVEAFNNGYKAFDVTTEWQRFISTDTVNYKKLYSFPFYTDSALWQVGDVIYLRDPQLEDGTVATTPRAAPEDLATVTALHAVNDTVDSHTRTIGAVGTAGSILDNVSKVTQTANGLVTEVSGDNGLKTQVSTLAGSYAIKSLTKAGDVLGQINLNKDGSIKLDGSLVQITGTTYIQDGVIASGKIASLDAGKITSGIISAARIGAEAITADKLKVDQAFFTKFMATEAYLKQIFAKDAFITQVQAVTLSAEQISGGLLTSLNGATTFNLNDGKLTFNSISPSIEFNSSQSAIRRVSDGQSQFLKLDYVNGATYTTIGANRSANDESIGTADFTGFQIQSRSTASGGLIDEIYAYADEFTIAGGGTQYDGIVFKNRQYLYPQLSGMLDLGRSDKRWNNVYASEYILEGVVLSTYLSAIKDCFQQIAYGGMTQTTYNYIKNKLSGTLNRL